MFKMRRLFPARPMRLYGLTTFRTSKADVGSSNLQSHRIKKRFQGVGEIDPDQTLLHFGHKFNLTTSLAVLIAADR